MLWAAVVSFATVISSAYMSGFIVIAIECHWGTAYMQHYRTILNLLKSFQLHVSAYITIIKC
jgi:hypothetical protein